VDAAPRRRLGPYQSALNNLTGLTGQQTDAEARLTSCNVSGFDLLFGASSKAG